MRHRHLSLHATPVAQLCLWAFFIAAATGCAYGPPTPSIVARPTIPADAAPVHEWTVDRVTVAYHWYKVHKYDIHIEAKGYFPPNYKDVGDAVWEVKLATIATADMPSVPGTFLGILRTYVDASGVKQYEIVPPVILSDLDDGMYAVIENGVEWTDGEPKTIKAIRPVVHIRMIKNKTIDPYYDMPVYPTPKNPTDLTPLPVIGAAGDGPKGTPLAVPVAPESGQPPKTLGIPGVPGTGTP